MLCLVLVLMSLMTSSSPLMTVMTLVSIVDNKVYDEPGGIHLGELPYVGIVGDDGDDAGLAIAP